MKFQLPPDLPPEHLWDVATWKTSLAAVEAQEYVFHRDRDDLDSFSYTEIEDEEIGKILLMLRDHAPLRELGLNVMVQSDVFTDDALGALRRRFGAADEDFSWITKSPHFAGAMGELLDPPMTQADREREYQESTEWFNARAAEEKQKKEDEQFYTRLAKMDPEELQEAIRTYHPAYRLLKTG